jgi:hypothetical protein
MILIIGAIAEWAIEAIPFALLRKRHWRGQIGTLTDSRLRISWTQYAPTRNSDTHTRDSGESKHEARIMADGIEVARVPTGVELRAWSAVESAPALARRCLICGDAPCLGATPGAK